MADLDQAFGEGQSNRGAPKRSSLANRGLRQSFGVTQKWLPFVGQHVANYMRFLGNDHSLKALYHYIRQRLKRVANRGLHFSQTIHISYIYKIYLKGINAC